MKFKKQRRLKTRLRSRPTGSPPTYRQAAGGVMRVCSPQAGAVAQLRAANRTQCQSGPKPKPKPKPAPTIRLGLEGLTTTIDLDQVIGKRKDESRRSARKDDLTEVGVLLRATDCSTHLYRVARSRG